MRGLGGAVRVREVGIGHADVEPRRIEHSAAAQHSRHTRKRGIDGDQGSQVKPVGLRAKIVERGDCLSSLQSIPADLYEAAAVDGASRWKQFRHVTLPLLKPALLPAVILGSVWTFNLFNVIYLVSGGEPGGATEILVSEAYRWAFQRNEAYGFAAAYSTLIFLVLLGYSAVTRRIGAEAT